MLACRKGGIDVQRLGDTVRQQLQREDIDKRFVGVVRFAFRSPDACRGMRQAAILEPENLSARAEDVVPDGLVQPQGSPSDVMTIVVCPGRTVSRGP